MSRQDKAKQKKAQEFNVTQKFLQRRNSKKKIDSSDSGLKRFLTNDVTSELDACLQGQIGSIAFKRMSRNDSIVGGILRNYENPIQSAKWSIEEIPNATPKELEIVNILNEWFIKRNDFGTLLHQILGMLPIGFSLFEKYFIPVEFKNNKLMMPVLDERVQTSIRKIDYETSQVEQQTTNSNLVYIPFKDLVFFSFRQDGNDKRGVSLLRHAYYDFLDKKEIKQAGTKGIIRAMIGLVLGKTPTNINTDDKRFDDFNDLIIELGERGFNGLSDSAVIPESYNIEILNSSFDLKAMKEYIAYLDSSIVMSVAAQFMTLGQSSTGGSYSLGRDFSDMFFDGLQHNIDYIGKRFSQQIIYQTVSMNWADVDPKKFNLVGANLNKKNSKEFAETLKLLIDSGVLIHESEDEINIRKMYGLPEIDIKDRERREQEKEESLQLKTEEQKEESRQQKETIKLSEHFTNPKERKIFIDQEVTKLSKFSRASLQLISDEFSKTIRRQLNKGNVEAQGLKDLKINNIGAYKKRFGQKLAGISMQAWKEALRNSKGKLKLAEVKPSDLPTQTLTSFVLNQSDIMIDKQLNDLREDSILTANTQASKGLSPNNTMAMVDNKMDNYISNKNRIEGGVELAVVQAMNYGEMEYYRSIEKDLWGFRFANDVPETEICKSLVGKTYPKDSSELDIIQPPLHFRCDSFLIPIYRLESPERPDFDNFIPSTRILKQKTI